MSCSINKFYGKITSQKHTFENIKKNKNEGTEESNESFGEIIPAIVVKIPT